MTTRPFGHLSLKTLRKAGKARLVSRLQVLLGRGQITARQAAHVLAAYREQVSPCR